MDRAAGSQHQGVSRWTGKPEWTGTDQINKTKISWDSHMLPTEYIGTDQIGKLKSTEHGKFPLLCSYEVPGSLPDGDAKAINPSEWQIILFFFAWNCHTARR